MSLRVASPLLSASLQGSFPDVAAGVGAGVGAGVMPARDRRGRDALIEDRQFETAASRRIAKQSKNVMRTNPASCNHNELAVSGYSSLASRSNGGLITSDIKLGLVNDKRFNAGHIKAVAENGTGYLMGIADLAEAATDVASTAKGVQRVARLFEYPD